MKIWFDTEASVWEEGLPIGNGRLGAMIFGKTDKELLQLNEDSIWYGSSINRNNPDAFKHLDNVRNLIEAGRISEAEALAKLALSGVPNSQRPYQTMGNLELEIGHPKACIEEYKRELNLANGTVTVEYIYDGIRFQRTYFSSAVDQVLCVRLTADQRHSVSLTAYLRRGRYLDGSGALSQNTVYMDVDCGGNGAVKYRTILRAEVSGGAVQSIGETILINKADEVVLYLGCSTSFREEEYKSACAKTLDICCKKAYLQLYDDHINDYQRLFNRVDFYLEGDRYDDLPTHLRLERIRNGYKDEKLICLYFNFARYLMISSSRPGSLPANLQGLWNPEFLPKWDSKYTININTQMNYWIAEVGNLSECHIPLFDLIERMRKPGRITATMMYGCRGFTAHHNTDIWGDTAPQDIYLPSTYWPMGAAWLCLHLWEHYQFNNDRIFLDMVYPTLRESALFFVDFLIENVQGQLVTCPSVSPENVYILENGERGCLCSGPSMDSQIITILFNACIQSATLLEIEDDLINTLKAMLRRLPKIEVGKYGQIQEWAIDYEEAEPGHRHISQLFGLFPGNLMTEKKSPQLMEAAKKTLERRLSHGGGHTGWSRAWIVCMYSRLKDSESAYQNILELLKHSTLPNLFDNHPPFQIDGNFGGAAGIAEMLLQSHDGEINLLPALPKAWSTGSIRGLKARSGLICELIWKDNRLNQAVIHSTNAIRISIVYQEDKRVVDFAQGEVKSLYY